MLLATLYFQVDWVRPVRIKCKAKGQLIQIRRQQKHEDCREILRKCCTVDIFISYSTSLTVIRYTVWMQYSNVIVTLTSALITVDPVFIATRAHRRRFNNSRFVFLGIENNDIVKCFCSQTIRVCALALVIKSFINWAS